MSARAAIVAAARTAAGLEDDLADPGGAAWGPGLARLAEHHGLAPTVHLALRDVVGVDARTKVKLASAYHAAVRTHLLAVDGIRFLADILDDDVRWLVVKGPILAERLYPRPDMRGYVDLDVLVAPTDYERALIRMESAGASVVERNWRRVVDERPGELRVRLPSGLLVDLHWHLLHRPAWRAHFPLRVEELLDRAQGVEIGGTPVATLDPAATALHLALHACLAGGDRLVWAVDLHRSLLQLDDPGALVTLARRTGTSLPVAAMLDRTHHVLGTEMAGTLVRSLQPSRAWLGALRAADGLTPLEQSTGGPSIRRIVTRATRRDGRSSAAELRRRVRRGTAGRLVAVRRESILLERGGVEARAAYFRDVVTGSPAGDRAVRSSAPSRARSSAAP